MEHQEDESSRRLVIAFDDDNDDDEIDEDEEESDNDDDGDDDVMSDDNNDLPLARNHSYLPGTSHPVYTGLERKYNDNSNSNINHSSNDPNHPSWIQELAVLELPDMVLFPGATIPIRLTNSDWIQYLRNQINDSNTGKCIVRLGILTQTRQHQHDNNHDARPWTRRGFGPARLRRLSERLLAELGNDFQLDGNNNNNNNNNNNSDDDNNDNDNDVFVAQPPPPRRRNNRLRLVRRLVARIDSDSSSSSDDNEENPPPVVAASVSTNSTQQQQQQQQQQQRRIEEERSRRRSTTYLNRIGTIATVVFTHDDNDNDNEQQQRRNSRRNNNNNTLVFTAIGTSRFRIVKYRSNDEENDYNNQLLRNNNRSIYFDNDGVKFFYIEELKDNNIPLYTKKLPTMGCTIQKVLLTSNNNNHNGFIRTLSLISPLPILIKKFWPYRLMIEIRNTMKLLPALAGIEENLPPLHITYEGCNDDDNHSNNDKNNNNNNNNINNDNDNNETTLIDASDLDLDLLEPTSASMKLLHPGPFSFWMAANLPLDLNEKLELLEMPSIIERLLFILKKVKEERADAEIHCKNCLTPFSSARDLFTVGGAEGTTGNYVNEHGIVHQTITLRNIDEDEVFYQGGPVITDSWFPGYSWTIMACGVCGHHLGWKFRLAPISTSLYRNSSSNNNSSSSSPGAGSSRRRNNFGLRTSRTSTTSTESINRPAYFYGVSAANVTTFIPFSQRPRNETMLMD